MVNVLKMLIETDFKIMARKYDEKGFVKASIDQIGML